MNGLFGFIDMMGNYESRKVDRWDGGENFIVDTCFVTDSSKPYETAVCHPKYNNGKWVIVELYDDREEAKNGHQKWVELMQQDPLPKELRDVSDCASAKWAFSENEESRIYELDE